MKAGVWLTVLFLAVSGTTALAVAPEVSNVRVSQRVGAELVDIVYDLADQDSSRLSVSVQVYTNDGANSYTALPAVTFVGDYGSDVAVGTNRSVVWDAATDWIGNYSSNVWIRVTANDMSGGGSEISGEMVVVQEGWFNMGDSYGEGNSSELPVHAVYVGGFCMSKYEVSNEEMRSVLQWAMDNKRVIVQNAGGGGNTYLWNDEGDNRPLFYLNPDPPAQIGLSDGVFVVQAGKERFPCVYVTWYGSQAYCNFRSEMEGLEPCVNFADWSCDFSKSGYRLPTEAEWEKAARGGLDGHHFPWPSCGGVWSDHIDGSKANYSGSGDPWEEYLHQYSYYPLTTPVGYYNGSQVLPGSDMANGFGLYDVAGNVWEWVHDWYSSAYYSVSPGVDPTGPLYGDTANDSFPCRSMRGGAYTCFSSDGSLNYLRCAHRGAAIPSSAYSDLGFRCVCRSSAGSGITERATGSAIYGPITVDTIGNDNPGVVQFNTSAISVDENAGSASLTVMRMGGTQGTATVDYLTADGTAVGGTDFRVASGTLTWADGDNTNQTITVNLTADTTSEGDETFTVVLSNPVGATIGTYTNMTVTIKDAGSQTPVYRLYSYGLPDSTYEHVWTTDWDEMATMVSAYGWYYEGVAWYAFSDYVQGSTPLYRVYAPAIRQHHYTTDGTEYYVLTEQSGGAWNGEGIQYYVYPDNSVSGTTPVYRFYHAGMGLHHFTISAEESATIQATPEWGYTYEDIAFYVYP